MSMNPRDDVQVLRQLVDVPADRPFPDGHFRHRANHLTASWQHLARTDRAARRRRVALRVSAPIAVAAALAGVFLTTSGPHTSSTTSGASAGSPQRITTAAYTLDSSPNGVVEVTLRKAGQHKINAHRLQQDLNRMGVPALVAVDSMPCPVSQLDGAAQAHIRVDIGTDDTQTAFIDTRRIPGSDILGMMVPRHGQAEIAEYGWFKNAGAGCTNTGT